MSDAASVGSIDAIRDLKAAVNQFAHGVLAALGEADMESRRVLDWLQRDQKLHWVRELRIRQEAVTEAKNALARKRLGGTKDRPADVTEEKKNLQRAMLRVQEAETKQQNVAKWERLVDRAVQDYQGIAQRLNAAVTGSPCESEVFLIRVLDALEAYLAANPPLTAAVAPSVEPVAMARPATAPTDEPAAPNQESIAAESQAPTP